MSFFCPVTRRKDSRFAFVIVCKIILIYPARQQSILVSCCAVEHAAFHWAFPLSRCGSVRKERSVMPWLQNFRFMRLKLTCGAQSPPPLSLSKKIMHLQHKSAAKYTRKSVLIPGESVHILSMGRSQNLIHRHQACLGFGSARTKPNNGNYALG